MSLELIKRRVEYCYISGEALKKQRENAGFSQKQLSDLIISATGENYIIMNGQLVAVNKMTVCRMEQKNETALEYLTAKIIQKILS